ncbi:glycosyltransferase family protein [Microbacterium testaceum]|uniref:glycosyltransferase family protein n=1 Tax=Microbacterium testaceum TaxID=2033 RepID=UPI0011447094|nr:glycosyltransferase [Microbacterium testaceum]
MQRSRLRGLIRRLREARGAGAIVRAADRLWWYRVISASSLVDTEYYAAQLGLGRVPASLAIAHYVSRGFRRGMSLNPLFDDVVAGWELPEVTRVPALYAYLVNERETISIHPWWDAVTYGAERGGPGLEAAWAKPKEQLQVSAAGHEWTLTVAEVRRRAISAARQWRRVARTRQTAPPRDTALVRIVQAHDRRYVRKLVQVARRADECDVLVPLVDVDASQWVSTALLADLVPGVRVSGHRRGTSWRSVLAAAVRGLSASTVVVLDPRAEFDDSQLDALISQASAGAAVCAAHRAADGTIDAVGAADVGGARPYALLSGLPGDDLTGLPESVDVPLLSGRTFAMPSAVLRRALDDVDDAEPDALSAMSRTVRDELPLRALPRVSPVLDEPAFAFAPKRAAHRPARGADERDRSRAEAVLEEAGFRVERWVEAGQGRVEPVLSWIRPHPDARRWAVKMCAPAGKQGAVWGDAHFARGLANALRRLGHTVVVDAYDARARSTTVVDDVSVAIRGPYAFEATSTGVNLEWIISHPDSLTRDEVAGFDRVFAASHGWAERAGRRWGLEIETLLPCTDTDVFHPRGLPRDEDIVFVGKTRGAARPSVVEPVKAGIPVRVYGPDWAHFVPASSIAAKSIPHERLAERYETASIVLNDQWPDMQREGFMTLRPFDVVAVEGRLVSEPVEGLEDLFEGAVVTYRDTAHLVEMLSGPADDLFPDADRLRRIAARVREEHSFDARAVVLDRAAREIAARGR